MPHNIDYQDDVITHSYSQRLNGLDAAYNDLFGFINDVLDDNEPLPIKVKMNLHTQVEFLRTHQEALEAAGVWEDFKKTYGVEEDWQ